MKDQSIYFFQLDSNKQIKNFERVFVDERIRDLSYKNGKLFLFLEDSASIGIISIPDTY